ncbi:MAG: hypothetical protein KIS76_14615 [Pyrinomonadaceae bacterium]|nr:hypothetical protein [Pyrinomonadaceae bacterium]
MQSNLAKKFLPIVSDDKKLDVSIVDDQAVIKLSTWTEDLGWCGQKTLSVDAAMLDQLHRVIASARVKLKSGSNNEVTENVLQFPVLS